MIQSVTQYELRKLDDELAIFVQCFSIDRYCPLTHIGDHVPMDGGVVCSARVRVGLPKGAVDCTGDFLVEERIACDSCDSRVRANCEFPQLLRSCVHLEH